MSEENEALVRSAYEAYGRGDVTGLLELVHPDLEWTYLDPSFENPQPQVCHGRDELAWALGRQADRGVNSELEEIRSCGDKVMVAVHTPGADQHRRAPTAAGVGDQLPGLRPALAGGPPHARPALHPATRTARPA